MEMIKNFFTINYYVIWVEVLTIIAILLFVAYVFYSLNLFKKE